MSSVRPEKPCGLHGTHDDSDVVIQTPSGPAVQTGAAFPCPVWSIEQAREFGRRGDRKGFDRWLCGQTSYLENRQRLQQEYLRAEDGEEPLPAWKRVWRLGIVPQLSMHGLEALRRALLTDDKRLLQGATCSPPPLHCVSDWLVEGADAISFTLWQGDGYGTVGQLEERFASVCCRASNDLGEPAAIRYFLNWWDESPREKARQQLLIECDLALIGRLPQEATAETTPLSRLLEESIRLVEKGGAA